MAQGANDLAELSAPERRAAALRFIVCLGIVSLFADMTYEGAHSIIGPYLKDLGASGFQVAVLPAPAKCWPRACGSFPGSMQIIPGHIGPSHFVAMQ